jgi:hypothetical protein
MARPITERNMTRMLAFADNKVLGLYTQFESGLYNA